MQKKKGISLIVLVITIIVMIILAAAIIISLSNNGIINNAQSAVQKTNKQEVQEIAQVAWGEAYVENKKASAPKEGDELEEYLEEKVKLALQANNLNPENYFIKITEKGVTIKNINEVWIQKADKTVVKGDIVLNIGSDITYDETNGGTVTVGKDVDWKVLGAENGELLIMTATYVKSKSFNSNHKLEGGKQAYETGIAELNEICAPYGKGTYATGARSITVEDVDRVTGYDKTAYPNAYIGEYGNVVTYKYNGTNKPAYVCSNGVSGTLADKHSKGFHWYDKDNVYHSVSESDLTNAENNGKEIGKLTNTYYTYRVGSRTDLEKGTDAYSMIFGSNSKRYWLASLCVKTGFDYARFGFFMVYEGKVDMFGFVLSEGGFNGNNYDVYAVVSLSPEFNP